MEKKEDAGAKLNVLLCNLVDYVRRDDRPLVFAVMLEITEYFEQELDKAREEENKRCIKIINEIIQMSGEDSTTQWFDGLRCARESVKLKTKEDEK